MSLRHRAVRAPAPKIRLAPQRGHPGEGTAGRLVLSFQAMQGLGTIGTLALAIWAIFFSTLPEQLENQYRVEITSAKEELLTIQRERQALLLNNTQLINQSATLDDQVAALRVDKAALEDELVQLAGERERYGIELKKQALDIILEVARFDLDTYSSVAFICANYAQHRSWLEAQREGDRLYADWEKQSFEEKWTEDNPVLARARALQAAELPTFWYEIPREPILRPTQSKEFSVLTAEDVEFLNATGHEEEHSYLIGRLFSLTLRSNQNELVTGAEFIRKLKEHASLEEMSEEDRSDLRSILDGFIEEIPSRTTVELNVIFDTEPAASQIIDAGIKQIPIITEFSSEFLSYLEDARASI